jgi:hypothetical protein
VRSREAWNDAAPVLARVGVCRPSLRRANAQSLRLVRRDELSQNERDREQGIPKFEIEGVDQAAEDLDSAIAEARKRGVGRAPQIPAGEAVRAKAQTARGSRPQRCKSWTPFSEMAGQL